MKAMLVSSKLVAVETEELQRAVASELEEEIVDESEKIEELWGRAKMGEKESEGVVSDENT